MKKLIDLGLKVNTEIVDELEEAYAVRFGYLEKIVDPDPKWKPSKKQPARAIIKNPESKREFMLARIKRTMKKIVTDHRAEIELKIKREKEKSVDDLI